MEKPFAAHPANGECGRCGDAVNTENNKYFHKHKLSRKFILQRNMPTSLAAKRHTHGCRRYPHYVKKTRTAANRRAKRGL